MTTLITKIKALMTPRLTVLITVWLLVVFGMMAYYKARFVISGEFPWTTMFAMFSLDAVFGYIVATILVFGGEAVGRMVDRLTKNSFSVVSAATIRYFTCATFGVLAVSAAAYGWFTLLFGFDTSPEFLVDMAVLSVGMPLVINGLMETFHYHGAWQAERFEKESAAREALRAEFEALRNQVSPHFLFNSFATLSHIIEEDPKRAAEFLENLSGVFRFVLQNREADTVPLSEELAAVEALLKVHQMRVPDGLVVETAIPAEALAHPIPIMALYTLVENALKHNVVSAERPLSISINFGPDNVLVVENNLQPKRTRHSLGTGLENLDRRLQHLLKAKLDIQKTDSKFIVRAPLMAVS
ncbi:MAG: histidine kinase [Kordiimonadaceae bacterium]|nr:histidine kinase [Kordiimonadaceae bacterium]MBO6570262.1 histidine kinase [Kordiimonadaceae bacterium]MBO6965640.1 histidine kinase [Kordiimonadaceae bacterium]